MAYTAVLAFLTEVGNIPDYIMPFLNFKAGIECRSINKKDIVAIFQVENIESYHPMFIDEKTNMKMIEDELASIDVKLDDKAKQELIKYLK